MNIGEVEITLGGKTETLRSSLGAAKRVNAAGGFTNVMEKLMAYDMSYYVTVVSAGLNKKPRRSRGGHLQGRASQPRCRPRDLCQLSRQWREAG
jgi:hypothetical protein